MDDILKEGYSTFSQVVIKDTSLNIKSKAIYLFLCAYKNKENIATPKRDTIMNYLGIGSKETYYKYIKALEEQGYITISVLKANGKYFSNQYKINTKIGDKDIFENYGIIPKSVMNDKAIPIDAKGVYGYFCTYRNKKSNDVIYANIGQIRNHLDIGTDRLNKNIKLLIEAGYIEKKQHLNEQKFSSNLYHLLGYRENIKVKDSNLTEFEIEEATQKDIEMRDLKNKTYKQVIETENRVKKEIRTYEERIKDNIQYNVLEENDRLYNNACEGSTNDDELEYIAKSLNIDGELFNFANDVVNIIIKTVFSDEEKIKIGNVEYPKVLMKEMFLKLKLEHIKEVLSRYRNANERDFVRNPSKYIETVLLNVCFDFGLVQVRNNIYGT